MFAVTPVALTPICPSPSRSGARLRARHPACLPANACHPQMPSEGLLDAWLQLAFQRHFCSALHGNEASRSEAFLGGMLSWACLSVSDSGADGPPAGRPRAGPPRSSFPPLGRDQATLTLAERRLAEVVGRHGQLPMLLAAPCGTPRQDAMGHNATRCPSTHISMWVGC